MDGYEVVPDPGSDWQPTKAQVRRQHESEDMREHAARLAAEAQPLSEETLQRVAVLLSHRTPPSELVEWRLRLFCGHVVLRTAHHTHTTVHAAFMGGVDCKECGLDPATIIAAEPARRLSPDPAAGLGAAPRRSGDAIRKAIARHEREIERLRLELGEGD